MDEFNQQVVDRQAAAFIVTLPDGYHGHTAAFLAEPIARDGALVKLRVAGRGREHLIRWIAETDLNAAVAAQVTSAKAWEYRDEKEGVQLLSLDRLDEEKRTQWTSERPLNSVPETLYSLMGARERLPAKSATMRLVALADQNPDKMRALAELLLVKNGSLLFGRIAARPDEAGMLTSMGIKVGGYDRDTGNFLVCVEPSSLDRTAVVTRDLDVSSLHVRNSARLGADNYPATIDEIDAEIAWCEYMLSRRESTLVDTPLDASKRADIESSLYSLRESRLEASNGPLPIPVTVVASHASYPIECSAKGLLLSGGRLVINYPFRWQDGTDPSFDPDAQIDISRVLLANGEELQDGWRDIGTSDVTADDYRVLDERVQRLERSMAMGQDLPETDDLYDRITQVMGESPWMIDVDSGKVVPIATEPLPQVSAMSMRM